MTRVQASLLVFLALVGSGGEVAAQRRGIRPVAKHDGFWLSLGAGGGWEDTYNGSGDSWRRGGAFSIRMGGTPNPRFLVGGEIAGWFNDSGIAEFTRVNAMAAALMYPFRAGGWFLKGGFGFAGYEAYGFDRSGLGLAAGTGFDIRLGRNFYLTPTVDYLAQVFDDSTVGVFLVTLGVTWH